MSTDIPDGPIDSDTRLMTDTLSVIHKQVVKVLNMPLCAAFIYNKGSTLQNNSPGADLFTRLGIDYNRDVIGLVEGNTLGEEISQAHKARGGE